MSDEFFGWIYFILFIFYKSVGLVMSGTDCDFQYGENDYVHEIFWSF